jgi:hypothetical protein
MELDNIKLKRLSESAKRLKGRVPRTTASLVRTTKRLSTDKKGRQVYATQATADGSVSKEDTEVNDDEALIEGKKPKTPDFVRHCVTAITEKPKELARVQQDAPGPDEGSPFAICNAKYNNNKRSLAAKHSKGEHHSVGQYEKALEKLREDVEEARSQNVNRSTVLHSDVVIEATSTTRHLVRYAPRG